MTESEWAEVCRIAGWCARTYKGERVLRYNELRDVAIDAILEHIAAYGWPSSINDVFGVLREELDERVQEMRSA